jgi:PncC family amidohydrolase
MIEHVNYIHDHCLANGLTVAVAESVTAGQLQLNFSRANNAAQFFQGGITAYNTGQKVKHLQVEPIHALDCNAVSQQVAIQMALGVCALFNSTVGIAATGYATPAPELGIYTLYAYYAITCKGLVLAAGKIVPVAKDPEEVMQEYAQKIIDTCCRHFKEQENIETAGNLNNR